jgi:hypothetical protein
MATIRAIFQHLRRNSIIMAFALLMVISIPIASASLTYAAPKDEVCNAIGANGCNDADGNGTSVQRAITFVVNALSVIAGIAGVIMMIVGGFKYVTSGGDSSKVASAKNTVIYALIGLAIAALAQVLVQFVLKQATNV